MATNLIPVRIRPFLHLSNLVVKNYSLTTSRSYMYRITKGQLITIWFFSILGWLASLWNWISTYGSIPFLSALVFIIPLILIFYTLGWTNSNNKGVGDIFAYTVAILFALFLVVGSIFYKSLI